VPDVSNFWLCAAIWVTTAAATAKLVSREILGSTNSEDEVLLKALDPARFQGIETD
jgi:glycine/D-amino acid oxidase-like deaminating enzyme